MLRWILRAGTAPLWCLGLGLASAPACWGAGSPGLEEELFQVQPYDEIILKDKAALRGTVIETDDKSIVKIKFASGAAREIARADIGMIKLRSGPENILDQIAKRFKGDGPGLAAHLREALRRFKGLDAGALKLLEQAAPAEHPEVLALLAERQLAAGNAAAGELTAQRLVARKAGFAEGHRLLGQALAAQAQPAKALEAFSKARELAPEQEGVLLCLAEQLLAMSRAEDAKKVFVDALAKNPRSAGAWVGQGYVLLRQGLSAEAIQSFERALEIDSRAIKAKLGLAACKALRKEFEDAYKTAGEVLDYDPGNAQAYGLQGYARLFSTDPAKLKDADFRIEQSLRANASDPRIKVLKALYLDRAAQWDDLQAKPQEAAPKRQQAALLLAEVEEAKPADAWLQYLLAELRYRQNDLKAAAEGFQRAAQLAPAFAPAFQAVGAVALKAGKWKEAQAAYAQAIKLEEGKGEYHAGLGLAFLGMKSLDEAKEELKKAIKQEPSNTAALCGLGYIANSESNELAARKFFHHALAADGRCAFAADALTRMYAQREIQFEYLAFDSGEPSGWNARGGRQVKAAVSDGKVRWKGVQGTADSGKMEYQATVNGSDFLRLEADLEIAKESPCVLALRLATKTGAGAAIEFEFGKNNAGQLAYRFRDFSGVPPDWKIVEPWPDSGKARLALETADLNSGVLNLYVNGVDKGKLPMQFAPKQVMKLGKITVGFCAEAPAKESVDARADNLAVLKRKLPEAEVDAAHGGALIPPEPKPEPPPKKEEAPK